MAKRQRPKPFDKAFGAIDKMEQAVCYRAVSRDYSIQDVCEYLWPPHVVAALRAAFPFVSDLHHNYGESYVTINDIYCSIYIDTGRTCMCTPREKLIAPQDEHGNPWIMRDLRVIAETHGKFNKLRNVVNWLNDNATSMAARYYFPSLGALLPKDHAFHTFTGLQSAGCRANIAEIAADIREATTTVATGLLCEPDKINNDASAFSVSILTEDGAKRSNTFALI